MTYEFNPDTSSPELPNPYKVENLCLVLAGAIALVCGLVLLYLVQRHLTAGFDLRAFFALAVASALLLLGVMLVWFACTQLRFLFGRSRPVGLAPELEPHKDGSSEPADYYKETLRQNAIRFDEPHGALNGVLYTTLRELVFAPCVVRLAAEKLLQRSLSLVAILASFLGCWALTRGSPAAAWTGVFYSLAAAPVLLLPLRHPLRLRGSLSEGRGLAPAALVALMVAAAIGPLVIGKLAGALPELGDFSINGVLVLALACALSGCAVFALALKNQLQPMPQAIGAARVQEAITINTHPSKLLEELDRVLMEGWYKRIPNRKYGRRSPQVHGPSGMFRAEVFEEVQPRPHAHRVAAGLGEALAKPYFRYLAVLTLIAAAFMASGAIAGALAGHAVLQEQAFSQSFALALGQLSASLFCFRAAHVLWGRFDFTSELIWVDLGGSYEAARINVGNQLAADLRTSKNVINVESMTLRVWVSEIDTVIFGKDGARQLIGMRGLQGRADELAQALRSFGDSRSMVIAPRSQQDVDRIADISQANAQSSANGNWSCIDPRKAAAVILSQRESRDPETP